MSLAVHIVFQTPTTCCVVRTDLCVYMCVRACVIWRSAHKNNESRNRCNCPTDWFTGVHGSTAEDVHGRRWHAVGARALTSSLLVHASGVSPSCHC